MAAIILEPPTDPTREVEVILAGLPRTGSLSMSVAVGMLLGGKVMHGGTHIFALAEDSYGRAFTRLFQLRSSCPRGGNKPATLALLRSLTAGYVAVSDLPPIAFLEELLELYPGAKVVLVHRDPEKWWASFDAILRQGTLFSQFLLYPLPGLRWSFTLGSHWAVWWNSVLGPGQPLGPGLMDAHREYVRRVVPEGRLLEMELGEGWKPLCEFLGRDVPGKEVPFPRLNEAKSRDEFLKKVKRRGMLVWLGIFGTVWTAGYLGVRLWRS